jgi:hypothetical protein
MARTAIGIKSSGELVIIVAEHHYNKPLQELTLGEVNQIIKNEKIPIQNMNLPTLHQHLSKICTQRCTRLKYTTTS